MFHRPGFKFWLPHLVVKNLPTSCLVFPALFLSDRANKKAPIHSLCCYGDRIRGGGSVVATSCSTLATPCTVAYILLCLWDFPGKNTGVTCHFLLQGTLPDTGIEPMSPARQVDFLPLSHQGSPRRGLSGIIWKSALYT